MHDLVDLARKLKRGTLKSRDLVDTCLAHIADSKGEGERAFLSVYAERARAQADWIDLARTKGWPLPPLSGIPLAVKDLFDVAGEVTRAGSHALAHRAPAHADAVAIERLRAAGFVVLGKNNMTEFAYSGLGLNAHFGTPLNPFDRETGRIPGGSNSGGAVAVADGMAAAAIGTDTGGSCRIPAAFCGVVGFKPTAARVPLDGVIPLARSLDSIGPLTRSVSCAAVLDSVLSANPDGASATGNDVDSLPSLGLRIGVLEGFVVTDLDERVARAFEAALIRLSQRGVRLIPVEIAAIEEIPRLTQNGGLVVAEAYAWHRENLRTNADQYDPWVRQRIEAGKDASAADYIELCGAREHIKRNVSLKAAEFDALILPTVAITPPSFDELADADTANQINRLCLRNTAIANFLDRPAISVPCHSPGTAPVGFMMMGDAGRDRRLLAIARGLEYAIRAPSG